MEKAFVLVYAHKPGISAGINRWLHGFCRANPHFVPLDYVHPADPHLERVLEEALNEFNFPGLKMHFLFCPSRNASCTVPTFPSFRSTRRAPYKDV